MPHLQVLDAVLSLAVATRALGSQGPELTALVTTYVLPRGFYSSLAKALLNSVSTNSSRLRVDITN